MTPRITNLHGLPEALVEAVRNDPYMGGGDISVTKLIDAPQKRVLLQSHHDAIEEDVSERIWSLLGQAVHHILERAGTDLLVEQRLFAEVAGWKLSGQFDRLHLGTHTLSDYKVTTTYKHSGNDGWTRQLNVLRWLCYQNGYDVEALEIVAIFRDWRKTEAERNRDYPQRPVAVIPVPMWTLAETESYIKERIALHQRATAGEKMDCTEDERWYSGDKWAITKPGAKRALRVVEDKPTEVPEGYVLSHRIGEYRRCRSYCEVAPFCSQWQETLAQMEAASADTQE